MDLRVDHVTVATRTLDALSDAFTEAGLTAEYGGVHSNGKTEMAVVGFRDGSYLELISTVEGASDSPWWDAPIRTDAGPCAWAVRVDDIETVSDDLRGGDVPVEGPTGFERERADGVSVEWDLAFLGEGDPGHTLPFLISDRTPRELRVQPTGALASSPVVGVDTVVLGVTDLEAAVDRFRSTFALGAPAEDEFATFDAEMAVFPDAPVALAAPSREGWFADRLDRLGPRPVAYLLGAATGFESSFDSVGRDRLAGRDVQWVPPTAPLGRPYVGLVETDREPEAAP